MSTKNIAVGIAAVVGIALTVLGLRFLVAPDAGATGFGVPAASTGDAGAYLTAKGVRDTVSGLSILTLLVTRQRHALGWMLLVGAIIPLGDAVTVLAHHGPPGLAYGMHGTAAVVLIALATVLLRSQPSTAPASNTAPTGSGRLLPR